MRSFLFFFLTLAVARAQHIWYGEGGGAGNILINEVSVAATSETTYYETLGWNQGGLAGGYLGIQDTPRVGHTFIYALWDPSLTVMVTKAVYVAKDTIFERFGGEGTGVHFLTEASSGGLKWNVGEWYTLLTRCWAFGNHTYFGYWRLDQQYNDWALIGIIDYPVKASFNYGATSFLENYTGRNLTARRKMYTRNGWKRVKGWTPFIKGSFDNGTIGGVEGDKFYMETQQGKPPNINSRNRQQSVPTPTAKSPSFPVVKIESSKISYDDIFQRATLTWSVDNSTCPQFAYSVSVFFKDTGSLLFNTSKELPHIQKLVIDASAFPIGYFNVALRLRDVLDKWSVWSNFTFYRANNNTMYPSFSPTKSPTFLPTVTPKDAAIFICEPEVSFNGISTYLQYPSVPQVLSSSLTITMWVTTKNVSGLLLSLGRSPSTFNGEMIFGIDGSGNLNFWDYCGSYGFSGSGKIKVNTGVKTFVSFVKSGRVARFYVDGVDAGSITSSVDCVYSKNYLYLGADKRSGASFYKGMMGGVSIFPTSLVPFQIKSLYEGQKVVASNISYSCMLPTSSPTKSPTFLPSSLPSLNPTKEPSSLPSSLPSSGPSTSHTFLPSAAPFVTQTNAPSSSSLSSSSSGFPVGAIIGIVVGIVFLMVLLFLVYFFFSRRKAPTMLDISDDKRNDSTFHTSSPMSHL